MLTILHARLQHYVNQELLDVQTGFRKWRGTRHQIANICWITDKQGNSRKTSTSISSITLKSLTVWIITDCRKLLKRWGYQTILLDSWETTVRVKKQQSEPCMEQLDWFRIEKGAWQGCLLSPCLFNLNAEHIMRNVGLDELQTRIKIGERHSNNLRYADDTTLMAESEEELKNLLMRVKDEREKP